MFWPKEADDLLVAMWNDGASLGVIAEGLRGAGYDVSRNAVAGRKQRLTVIDGTPFKRASKTATKTRPQRRPPPPKPRQWRRKKTVPKPVTADDIAALSTHVGVEYLELTPFGCKAILNQPRSGPWKLQRVCGLPRYNGGPYCQAHFHLYTHPQPIRRGHG